MIKNRNEKNQFTVSFPFFHVLTFEFLKVELKKMNWRTYIHAKKPIAAALLSKMGYTNQICLFIEKNLFPLWYNYSIGGDCMSDQLLKEILKGVNDIKRTMNERFNKLENLVEITNVHYNEDVYALLKQIARQTKNTEMDIQFLTEKVGHHERLLNRLEKQ